MKSAFSRWLFSDMRIFIFVILGLFGVSALAAVSSTASVDALPPQIPGCVVPDVPERFVAMLCAVSFSPSGLKAEFDRMLRSPDAAEREKLTQVLINLWKYHSSSLKAYEIRMVSTRATLAHFLAPIVRNGDTRVRLNELQEFAIAYSRAIDDPNDNFAYYVLGDTGAPNQAPFLQSVIENNRANSEARIAAISAMGTMCDAGTADLLRKLKAHNTGSRQDRFVDYAIKLRASPQVRRWCAREVGSTN